MVRGKVVSLCPAHQEYFRQLRAMELELADGWPGPEVGSSDTRRAGRHKPPRKRRPGTTTTTDAITTLGVGAGLGVMVRMAPPDAWWPYLMAPAAAFLLVIGVLGLWFDRKRSSS